MKKLLSILMAMCLVFSLCTMAISSVSAEDLTCKDFGFIEGTGVKDAEYIVDDPVVEGKKAYKIACNDDRPNLKLADPANKDQAFVLTNGTRYTVRFDYYLNANTTSIDFTLYYGKHPTTDGDRSKVEDVTNYGISKEFIGDGQWHTGAISFKAELPKNGETLLDNIYLTYFSSGVISGYIKNVEIITETKSLSKYDGTYNFSYFFDENGKAKANLFKSGSAASTFGASAMTNSYVNEAGETVFVPTNDLAPVTSNKRVIDAYDYVNICVGNGKSFLTYGDTKNDDQMIMVVKYKVLKLGESGKAVIGVGRPSDTKGKVCLYNSFERTSTSDKWAYWIGTVPYQGGYALRLVFGGAGSEIAIDTVELVQDYGGSSVSIMTYNDNGVLHAEAVYPGTDLLRKGANEENLAMGEKFLGWYSDATCTTTKVTKAPETDTDLYAKYPTVILDRFQALNAYSNGNQKVANVVGVQQDGTMTVNSCSEGAFLIPAYEAQVAAGYIFNTNTKYQVKIYYNSVKTTDDAPIEIQWIRGDRYGGTGKRQGPAVFKYTVSTTDEPGVMDYTFSYETQLVNTNVTPNTTVNTLMYRGSGSADKFTDVVIDKITITDLSTVPLADKELQNVGSIREESNDGEEYVSAGIRFKGTVSEAFRASATEIGFYAAPTAALNGASMADYVKTENNIAIAAQVKAEGMEEILYNEYTDAYGRKAYDYQLIITGLTREGVAENLLGTEITCVMYAIVGGDVVITNEISYCYNDIAE